MTQYPDGGQNAHQRGQRGEQVPDRSVVQTEGQFAWEEDEAAREAAEAQEAEAYEEWMRQIDEQQQADDLWQQELLRQIDEQQAADFWQQRAQEDADFGLYPFIDPGLYW